MITAATPSIDSEITWLLHRAAQRMHTATGEQAEKHGLQLRDYIVLSALDKSPGLTQAELAKTLGLDKTTLMSQLDRLEGMSLIVRKANPLDRRARIPQLTETGEEVRAEVAHASADIEKRELAIFSTHDINTFRRMLVGIIGDSEDPGSCL